MAFNGAKFVGDDRHYVEGVPRIHYYATTETQAQVRVDQYFNPVASKVAVGDEIRTFVETGGTQKTVQFIVLSNDGTDVDVDDGTVLGTTDTD
ncbi:MAG: hypothetical protein CMF62_06400 [Magnetococcales bacterium]|nr:hypothetical protein [Magnetococcales bacterium]|tara:strand:+ start:316 stop:594 length:279 start_codon:yes stop_codon:yes gene_type:complete